MSSFSYGKALQEASGRAPTRDHKSVTDMSIDELRAAHETSKNATRSQEIRNELSRRGEDWA